MRLPITLWRLLAPIRRRMPRRRPEARLVEIWPDEMVDWTKVSPYVMPTPGSGKSGPLLESMGSPSMMARLLSDFHAEHPEHRRIFLADVRREGTRLLPYDPMACPALRDPEAAD